MLYVILLLIIIILILEKLINKRNNKILHLDKIKEMPETTEINYNNYYEKKEYLLTKNELYFYKTLKQATDELNLNLFVQVSLYAIIKNKNYKDFNKIKSKSIDFVITEKNCKIKLCIELDDTTHKETKRIERDEFLSKLFKDLNIKLIRIKVNNYYSIEQLKNIILNENKT